MAPKQGPRMVLNISQAGSSSSSLKIFLIEHILLKQYYYSVVRAIVLKYLNAFLSYSYLYKDDPNWLNFPITIVIYHSWNLYYAFECLKQLIGSMCII